MPPWGKGEEKAEFISVSLIKRGNEGIWWAGRKWGCGGWRHPPRRGRVQQVPSCARWKRACWTAPVKRAGCQRRGRQDAIFGLENAAASRRVESLQPYLCCWFKHAEPQLLLRSRDGGKTYFCHHCKSQEIAYGAHHGDEHLPPVTLPEDGGKQIHDGGDLSFHFNKLQGDRSNY